MMLPFQQIVKLSFFLTIGSQPFSQFIKALLFFLFSVVRGLHQFSSLFCRAMKDLIDSKPASSSAACNCTGIRFCAKCRHSERVQQLFDGTVPLSSAEAVISKQDGKERLSSCSFAVTKSSTYSCCPSCMNIFASATLIKTCGEHIDLTPTTLHIDGLYTFANIITAMEEERILAFLDNPAPFCAWKDSQSGRRKQDYGPRRNFKKKKVKPAEMPMMPIAFKPVFEAIADAVSECTGKSYKIAEVSALEYTESNLSNFDPHVDDTWLWGDRIAGLNLNAESAMTFVNPEGDCCDVYFPRRSFFLMSGECRYKWMHGIRPDHVHGRRVSLTFRELSDEILADSSTAKMVLAAASNFV